MIMYVRIQLTTPPAAVVTTPFSWSVAGWMLKWWKQPTTPLPAIKKWKSMEL
jgi:hypothetical protein